MESIDTSGQLRAMLFLFSTLPLDQRDQFLNQAYRSAHDPAPHAVPQPFKIIPGGIPDPEFTNLMRGILHKISGALLDNPLKSNVANLPFTGDVPFDYAVSHLIQKGPTSTVPMTSNSKSDAADAILTASLDGDPDEQDFLTGDADEDHDLTGGFLSSVANKAKGLAKALPGGAMLTKAMPIVGKLGKGVLKAIPGVGLAVTAYDLASTASGMMSKSGQENATTAKAGAKIRKVQGQKAKGHSAPQGAKGTPTPQTGFPITRDGLMRLLGPDKYKDAVRSRLMGAAAEESLSGDVDDYDMIGPGGPTIKMTRAMFAKLAKRFPGRVKDAAVGTGKVIGAGASYAVVEEAIDKVIADDPAQAVTDAEIQIVDDNAPGSDSGSASAFSKVRAPGLQSGMVSKNAIITSGESSSLAPLMRLGERIRSSWGSAFLLPLEYSFPTGALDPLSGDTPITTKGGLTAFVYLPNGKPRILKTSAEFIFAAVKKGVRPSDNMLIPDVLSTRMTSSNASAEASESSPGFSFIRDNSPLTRPELRTLYLALSDPRSHTWYVARVAGNASNKPYSDAQVWNPSLPILRTSPETQDAADPLSGEPVPVNFGSLQSASQAKLGSAMTTKLIGPAADMTKAVLSNPTLRGKAGRILAGVAASGGVVAAYKYLTADGSLTNDPSLRAEDNPYYNPAATFVDPDSIQDVVDPYTVVIPLTGDDMSESSSYGIVGDGVLHPGLVVKRAGSTPVILPPFQASMEASAHKTGRGGHR